VEVVFGGISSLLYGVADFLGGEGAKRVSAASVVLWAGVVSFPILAVVALVIGGDASTEDYLLGGLAGACGAIGLVALFAGLGKGRAAAVAPVSAALGATVPIIAAVIGGERPSTLSWIGVALAFPAVMLCAWSGDQGGARAGGFFYGVVAGLGFGGFTAIFRWTAPESNLLPLIASRGATMVVVLLIAGLGYWRVAGPRQVPMRVVAASGLFDVTANVTLLLAVRAGSLALAAVASEFYPAVTVLLARIVNDEHLRRRQGLGLVLALLAMTAIAVG
jgi:drug/metabolite transporter (DMT)-like permease